MRDEPENVHRTLYQQKTEPCVCSLRCGGRPQVVGGLTPQLKESLEAEEQIVAAPVASTGDFPLQGKRAGPGGCHEA